MYFSTFFNIFQCSLHFLPCLTPLIFSFASLCQVSAAKFESMGRRALRRWRWYRCRWGVSRGFTRFHEPETCTGFRWISGKRPIAAISLRICHGFQDSDPHWHYDRDEDSSASLTLCFMQINHCIIQSLYHCINHCQCHWDCFFCSFRMISSTMHRALPRLASKRRSMFRLFN